MLSRQINLQMRKHPMADNKVIQLTEIQLKDVVKDGVMEALMMLGIEADDPLEMQRDFQHLREWRLAVAAMRKRGLLTLVGIIVAGTCGALWIGLKGSIGSP